MGRRALLCVLAVPAAICAVWTLYAGKDLNWDFLNYHYYGPFQLLAGRLGQDFFAASAQSYLNPVGYLPFYAMLAAGWHSVAVSLVFALAHSLSLALLYLIAWKLFAHLPRRERIVLSCLASALGASSAVFWAMVGTSFLDPLLAAPMLGGVLLLLAEGHTVRRALAAGLLLGVAAALKYTNAIYALAALPLVLAMPGLAGAARVRAVLAYAAGGVAAVALLAGPWMVLLAREFGNPVFPLMNAWFRSPDLPAINLIGERFTPHDLGAALAFPFRMVVLDRALYAEIFAPDIRLAALAVVSAGVGACAAARRLKPAGALNATDWRVLAFVAVALALWLASSANARYGMPVLLLAGVALARLVERLLPLRAARIVLAVLLAVQLAAAAFVSPPRWYVHEPWSRHWLAHEVPARAQREPALYLTAEFLPMAVIAPFVHPSSSFVNLRGQHTLASDAPRLTALLERHRGSVRVLSRELDLQAQNAIFERIGYRVDADDCFAIPWRPDSGDWLSRAANRLGAGALPAQEHLALASCALRAAPRAPADIEAERSMSLVFDRVEGGCPKLFRGQTAVTERLGSGWSRYYAGLDARLETHGGIVLLHRYRVGLYVALGPVADWLGGGAAPEACR